jgi:hypothetical protein
MSTHCHLLQHPEWTGFRESLMGLDGRSLWLTTEGQRRGPYRIAILGAGMGSPTCRRYAIELIPGRLGAASRSLYLDPHPHVTDHITSMRRGRGKLMQLDLDTVDLPSPT